MNHMVSHGLNPLRFRFNGLYFKNYWELARPTLTFLLQSNVASFKCKNNFLTKGCNRSSKKTIWLPHHYDENCMACKIALGIFQRRIPRFPIMMHSFQATGYPIVSQLNNCLKFKSIPGIKVTVLY